MTSENSGQKRPSELAAYEDLFERMADPIFILDLDHDTILEYNPACERVLGLHDRDLVGKPIREWLEPAHQDSFSKNLRIAKRRQYATRSFDVVWKKTDGTTLTLEVFPCRLKLSSGAEVLQVIAKDVSLIRRAGEELKSANQKLEALSIKDEMTGLYNYRHFNREFTKEHERSQRYGTQYAIIFCDVDHFKKLNDTHGHKTGDLVLKHIAQVLQKKTRNTDLCARYGGEEFVVLCPGVNWEGAKILADRLRQAVEESDLPCGRTQPLGKVTISVGVSSYPTDGVDKERILEHADAALYHSKENGRNQVTASAEIRFLKVSA